MAKLLAPEPCNWPTWYCMIMRRNFTGLKFGDSEQGRARSLWERGTLAHCPRILLLFCDFPGPIGPTALETILVGGFGGFLRIEIDNFVRPEECDRLRLGSRVHHRVVRPSDQHLYC